METQLCPRCEETLPISSFARQTTSATGRGSYCRDCKNRYNAKWYRENSEAQGRRVAANTARYMARNRRIVARIKEAACLDCGLHFDDEVMEFDHVRGEKRMTVSALVRRGSSEEALLAEIEKCDLVCANCHRVRTKRRRKAARRDSQPRSEAAPAGRASSSG